MKIGLVRHFRVQKPFPTKRLLTAQEVNQWLDDYELADVEPCATDLGGITWHRCYASDLPRAMTTAKALYPGEIVALEALRELQARAFFQGGIRLPFLLWAVLARLALATSHQSMNESRREIHDRVGSALTVMLQHDGENVLIVSHAVVMRSLRRALVAQGFKGPRFGIPENGRLYLFER